MGRITKHSIRIVLIAIGGKKKKEEGEEEEEEEEFRHRHHREPSMRKRYRLRYLGIQPTILQLQMSWRTATTAACLHRTLPARKKKTMPT